MQDAEQQIRVVVAFNDERHFVKEIKFDAKLPEVGSKFSLVLGEQAFEMEVTAILRACLVAKENATVFLIPTTESWDNLLVLLHTSILRPKMGWREIGEMH